ncbi:MAG: cytochrome C [Mesorhizobium sp.]|nr:MAG: cytochrome C [Mesorhizobium sp.]TIP71811.1 MAG: cytochrome C [Mesorhizobium sp.]TIQ14703.1 MAG: cytochrome C [Mesorhizobium sp.]TIR52383.1 MAG: cytochrome C [Mesorhizobium sp.]TJV97237.1 MAG: cytochrome C [Mesorhizobium sp.]
MGGAAASVAAAVLAAPQVRAQAQPPVIVIGGGFAGASCARALKQLDRDLAVTLIEPETVYLACPFSNAVLAGLRGIEAQTFRYDQFGDIGLIRKRAVAVDAERRRVRLEDGTDIGYVRLVLAPGVDLRFDALPGYDEAAVAIMPHAWKAGAQTLLLRDQLAAMPDGGVVILSAPANPFRCPPGPYERASLIAHYLKTSKPRSKLIILDAKDAFSKQRLFEAAWQELYPGLIEWVPLSSGGRVTEVDPATRTLVTEFGNHKADVANVIPPQRAGGIAQSAGVADQTGWCPIDPVTFESRLQPAIHVIGDAAIGGAMPKSAFSANAQAKACAAAVAALVRERQPAQPKLINTCYSLVAPGYGISIAGVYRPRDGLLAEVEGAGGTSPLEAPLSVRELEAAYAEDWFRTITSEVFG